MSFFKLFKGLIVLAGAAFIAASCTDGTGDEKLSITPSKPSIPAAGGSVFITVISPEIWTLEISDSWLTADPMEGEAGIVNVELTAGENNTGAQRQATVTAVTENNGLKRVTVTQDAVTNPGPDNPNPDDPNPDDPNPDDPEDDPESDPSNPGSTLEDPKNGGNWNW